MPGNNFAFAASAEVEVNQSAWRGQSRCRAHPTRWWFATDQRETSIAKAICSGCPVLESCLEFALGRPDLHGIWAATTAAERSSMRVVLRAAETEPEPDARPAEDGEPEAGAITPDAGPTETPSSLGRTTGDDSPRPAGDDDLITPREAARRLGVTPNTVTRWSRAGRIPAVQTIGGHRRFRQADIEALLADQQRQDQRVASLRR